MPELRSRSGRSTAAVDVTIPTSMQAGHEAAATVELAGGHHDRHVDRLEVRLRTDVETPDGRRPATVAREPLGERITVHAADRRTVDVPIAVPASTPVTIGGTQVWAEVSGDRGVSIHPRTSGPLSVAPGERLAQLLNAASALGFFLVESTPVLLPTSTSGPEREDRSATATEEESGRSIVQRFRFRPEWGPFEDVGDLYLRPVVHGDEDLVARVAIDENPYEMRSSTAEGKRSIEPGRQLRVGTTNDRAVRSDLERLLEAAV